MSGHRLRKIREVFKRGGYDVGRKKTPQTSFSEVKKVLRKECSIFVDTRGRNAENKYYASSISVKIVDGVCQKRDCAQSCRYNKDFQRKKERRAPAEQDKLGRSVWFQEYR